MNCHKVNYYLQDLLDGSLPQEIVNEIEDHILECESCQNAYNELKMLQKYLQVTDEPVKIPKEEFFQNTFKVSLEKSKNYHNNPIRNFFQSIESVIQNFIFNTTARYQLARTFSVLFIGVLIGVSIFKQPASEINSGLNQSKIKTDESQKSSQPAPLPTPSELLAFLPQAPQDTEYIDKSIKSSLKTNQAVSESEKIISDNAQGKLAQDVLKKGEYIDKQADMVSDMLNSFNTLPEQESSQKQIIPISQVNEDKLTVVANQIRNSDLLNTLQSMKINLYLSGDEQLIPEVHRVEQIMYDIVSSDKSEKNEIDAFKVYQKAEESLLNKNYFDAVKYYYEAARRKPNSLIAFLSHFQLANIDFEILQNFRSALSNYEKCLEKFPAQFLTEEKKNLILSRVDLLTKNSQDNWQPLILFLQAKNSNNIEKTKLVYQKMITDYPFAPLSLESIKSLVNMACSEQEDNPVSPSEIINFLQNCLDSNKFESPHKELIQLGIGDIFNFKLKDYSQARIEYSRIIQNNIDSQFAAIAQSRIQRINAKP